MRKESAENIILTGSPAGAGAAVAAASAGAGTACAAGTESAGKKPRTRMAWPDWIRGAAMFAVVSVHLSGVSGFPGNPLLLWFNSFAMAVFFFVSGDLMIRSRKASVAAFVKRRAASVLWPFFTFSACAVLFDLAILRLNGARVSKEMVTVWLRCIFTLVGKGTLWFLPVFFFASALAYAALKVRKNGAAGGPAASAGETSGNADEDPGRPCIPEILVFLLGLGAMAFIDQIFAATVAAVTGGGDGVASDIFLVVIRSLAAAAIILEGAWIGPCFDRIAGTKKGTLAALFGFGVSLVIPVFYRMDFRTAQFGRCPVFLLISAAAAYCFLRQAAELSEKIRAGRRIGNPAPETDVQTLVSEAGLQTSASTPVPQSSCLTYFGRYSLIVMATHLEWYLVNLVWNGVAAVAGTAADFGPGYLARHLAALALVMMIEYPLCGIIDRRFGFLLRMPGTRR